MEQQERGRRSRIRRRPLKSPMLPFTGQTRGVVSRCKGFDGPSSHFRPPDLRRQRLFQESHRGAALLVRARLLVVDCERRPATAPDARIPSWSESRGCFVARPLTRPSSGGVAGRLAFTQRRPEIGSRELLGAVCRRAPTLRLPAYDTRSAAGAERARRRAEGGGRTDQGRRLRTVTHGLPGVSRPATEK